MNRQKHKILLLRVLSKHKNLFDDNVVIDPSMLFGDRKVVQQVLDSVSKNDYSGKSLFWQLQIQPMRPRHNKICCQC